ncbi:hypothetical protein ACFW1M_11070 [Streptomyces inhibens]|uniref:hypothetical protein n=1 Tax=Streptomyces inhibens TaxID=2293571 RepID=UPI0036B3C780
MVLEDLRVQKMKRAGGGWSYTIVWPDGSVDEEAALTRTQREVFAQRQRIGELMGQLRGFDQMVPGESVQALTVENTTLKRRVQQLTREHRSLQERLESARSNLRFADKRIADLEAQLLEGDQSRPVVTSVADMHAPYLCRSGTICISA